MIALTCLAADAPLPAPSAPGPEPGREWSDQEKSAVASQIHMYALLMRYCIEQARFSVRGTGGRGGSFCSRSRFWRELAVPRRTQVRRGTVVVLIGF